MQISKICLKSPELIVLVALVIIVMSYNIVTVIVINSSLTIN